MGWFFDGERVLATEIKVGDRISLIGRVWFTVEWIRADQDGGVCMAGIRSTGEAHINRLSAHAKVDRILDIRQENH